jgi:hypothetical protein
VSSVSAASACAKPGPNSGKIVLDRQAMATNTGSCVSDTPCAAYEKVSAKRLVSRCSAMRAVMAVTMGS